MLHEIQSAPLPTDSASQLILAEDGSALLALRIWGDFPQKPIFWGKDPDNLQLFLLLIIAAPREGAA